MSSASVDQGFGIFTFVEPKDIARIRYIAKAHPKVIRSAWNGCTMLAANTLRKTFRSGGGSHAVPRFADRHYITQLVHGSRWGGSMPDRFIRRWMRPGSRGAVQYVGFVDNVGFAVAFGTSFQTAGRRTFTRREKLYISFRTKVWPKTPYSRPARPVIEPFSHEMPKIFGKYFTARVEASLRRLLKKNGVLLK